MNGRQIKYFKDGRRIEEKFVDGYYNGRRIWYDVNRKIERQEVWEYDLRIE